MSNPDQRSREPRRQLIPRERTGESLLGRRFPLESRISLFRVAGYREACRGCNKKQNASKELPRRVASGGATPVSYLLTYDDESDLRPSSPI